MNEGDVIEYMGNSAINNVLFRVLLFYLGEVIVLLSVITLCVWSVFKSKSAKSDKLGILSVVLIVFFLVNLFANVIPFFYDYSTNNIYSVEGMYSNTNSEASTDLLGIYGVTISCADTDIHLTTAPLHSKDDFPEGTFYVTAYYTGKSKILLFLDYDAGAE